MCGLVFGFLVEDMPREAVGESEAWPKEKKMKMSPNNKTRIAKLSFVVLLCSFSSSFLCPTFLHTTGTRTLHEREDSVLVPVVWEVGSEAYIIAPQQLPRNNRQKSCGELLFMGSCVWGAIISFTHPRGPLYPLP